MRLRDGAAGSWVPAFPFFKLPLALFLIAGFIAWGHDFEVERTLFQLVWQIAREGGGFPVPRTAIVVEKTAKLIVFGNIDQGELAAYVPPKGSAVLNRTIYDQRLALNRPQRFHLLPGYCRDNINRKYRFAGYCWTSAPAHRKFPDTTFGSQAIKFASLVRSESIGRDADAESFAKFKLPCSRISSFLSSIGRPLACLASSLVALACVRARSATSFVRSAWFLAWAASS
jgi:hypothetical protein